MAFEPLRMSGGNEFTDAFGELNKNNTLAQARLAQAGIDSYWNRKAAKEVADARAYGAQGGGFGIGDALKLGGSLLGAAKGAGLFGGGGGSFNSFTGKGVEMPGYMSGAGNFSSFWGG